MRGAEHSPIVLSQFYEKIYDRLLSSLADEVERNRTVAVFWPMCGERYDGDLMIIGRATRTWYRCVRPAEMTSPDGRRNLLREKRAHSESHSKTCHQRWVVGNWGHRGEFDLKRSQFWRVSRQVTLAADPGRGDAWPLYICYTNLFKVAAAEGNPSGPLKAAQTPIAVELLHQELSEYAPKRILVLTGRRDWFQPFAESLGIGLRENKKYQYVEGVAAENGRRWVIAPHPSPTFAD